MELHNESVIENEPILSVFDSRRGSLQDSPCLRRTEMSGEDIMSMRRESSSHLDLSACQQRPNLSFSGCGFNGLYHVGVCAALQDFASHLYEDNVISGASAGSIAAVCMMCNLSMRKCTETMMDVISTCKKEGMLFSNFNLNTHLKASLERILPENAHVVCNGKLNISMTKVATNGPLYSLQNYVVNTFDSKDELITAVMCSSFIPMVSGFYFPQFKGMSVMDGGFTNNLIEMNDATITVTPFAAEADICPMDSVSHQCAFDIYNTKIKFNFFNFERMANLIFPSSATRMIKLLRLGYDDCIRYLLLRKFIFCDEHARVFTDSGKNFSDTCTDCQLLVQRAGSSSLPTYLEEMVFEKEPATYSYWGSVLDNRFTNTLYQFTDACSSFNDLQFKELCHSMDIMRHLQMYPFIRIMMKPIEWYFWIFKNIWNILSSSSKSEITKIKEAKKDTDKKSLRRSQKRSNSLISTSCQLEDIAEQTIPSFYVPEEELTSSNIEVCHDAIKIESYINSAVETWKNPCAKESGVVEDEDIETSIIELIAFRKSDEFDLSMEQNNNDINLCDEGIDVLSNCDSDAALSVDG